MKDQKSMEKDLQRYYKEKDETEIIDAMRSAAVDEKDVNAAHEWQEMQARRDFRRSLEEMDADN